MLRVLGWLSWLSTCLVAFINDVRHDETVRNAGGTYRTPLLAEGLRDAAVATRYVTRASTMMMSKCIIPRDSTKQEKTSVESELL